MKAAIYCRVSTEEQVQAGTIDAQVQFARRYCDLNQVQIVEWYLDDGVTGTIPIADRPSGKRLMADAKAGRFETVLVYRVDRFGRNLRNFLNDHFTLEQLGVSLRSMTEPFDTSTPMGRAFMQLAAVFANMERDTIVERMTQGQTRVARNGKWPAGKPPYGYSLDKDKFPVIKEEEADIVRLVYRLYTECGMTLVPVAMELNNRGVLSCYAGRGYSVEHVEKAFGKYSGGRWSAHAISNILKNSAYKGEYVFQTKRMDEPVIINVPPIVTDETWGKAQQLLRVNYNDARRNRKHFYLLSGLIKCGICGSTYSGVTGAPPYYPRYYGCGAKQASRRLGREKCDTKNIKAESLEDQIWADIVQWAENPGAILSLLTMRSQESAKERQDIEAKIADIDHQLTSERDERLAIISLLRKRIISEDEATLSLESLGREMKALEALKSNLFAKLESNEAIQGREEEIRRLLERLRERAKRVKFDEKREIVKLMVQNIVIHPGQPPVVTYVFGQERTIVGDELNLVALPSQSSG